jgi:hypothetical protein
MTKQLILPILVFHFALAASAAPAIDPICGTWKWFDNNVREFQAGGIVVSRDGKTEALWQCETPNAPASSERRYVVTFGGGRFVDRLTLKNGGTFLDGVNNHRVRVTATRISAASTAPATAQQPQPAPGNGGLYGGMALAKDWITSTLQVRRELIASTEFYCKAATGNAERLKEPVPDTLLGPIRWLMPAADAIKTLPARVIPLPERPVIAHIFPADSLTLLGFQYNDFLDRGQGFNQLFLLVDKQRRVVGVQLVDQTVNRILWEPQPDGVREPYYNFLAISVNASTTNEVHYQIRNAGNGVTLIKTALFDRKRLRYRENVHWYLAAPFARAMLDIVEFHRKKGTIR